MKTLFPASLRLLIFLAIVAHPALWAQRVSPDAGFFSLETPQNWNLTRFGNILTWDSPDGNASLLASVIDEHLSDADARSFFEERGFRVTGSDEKTFHGFGCLYLAGTRQQAFNVLKGVMYFCQVRRGSARDAVFVLYWIDANFENSYASVVDKWLDSFRWDGNVKDDR